MHDAQRVIHELLLECQSDSGGGQPSPISGPATPTSKQLQVLVPSVFALWILAFAFFNWCYCVLCVLFDTLVLRRMMMIIFCVKEADLGMMALVAYLACCLSACAMHSVTRKQNSCPSNTRRWFHQFLVIHRCLDQGGGGSLI